MNKKFFLAACLSVVFLFQGCVSIVRFDASRPKIPQGKSLNICGSGEFKTKNLVVSLKPLNYVNSVSLVAVDLGLPERFQDAAVERFYIEVGLLPKTDNFEFDPSSMTIMVGGHEVAPAVCYGPSVTKEKFICGLFRFQEFKEYLWKEGMEPNTCDSTSIAKGRWTGFLLRYDIIPPLPTEEFSMSLAGITDSGSPLDISGIDFGKGNTWIMDDNQ